MNVHSRLSLFQVTEGRRYGGLTSAAEALLLLRFAIHANDDRSQRLAGSEPCCEAEQTQAVCVNLKLTLPDFLSAAGERDDRRIMVSLLKIDGVDSDVAQQLVVSEAKWSRDADLESRIKDQKVGLTFPPQQGIYDKHCTLMRSGQDNQYRLRCLILRSTYTQAGT